jgi:hypothetical protein
MFSVLFEVYPKGDQWNHYLDNAKMLRPELEKVESFVDCIRHKSLTREGWIRSPSNRRDEEAVVRWCTLMRHHAVQEKGRSEIVRDYHLRVGEITEGARLPPGRTLTEQRLDETEVGEGTTVVLIDGKRPAEFSATSNPWDCVEYLGINPYAEGKVSWDIFEAVFTPGDVILMMSWRDKIVAEAFSNETRIPDAPRLRRVRVIRDYGMFDRREARQYDPDVRRGNVGRA